MIEDYDGHIERARLHGVLGDLYRRLGKAAECVGERLWEDENGKPPVFRDSMIENVRDLVDVVPRLDVFEGAELAGLCREVRDRIARVDPDVLRPSRRYDARAREQVKQDAAELHPETVVLLRVDAAVQDTALYACGDPPERTAIKGRGGTDFRPGFAWLSEQGLRPGCCLYLADMECDRDPEAEPGCPVVWCNQGPPPGDRNLQPWGERIDMAGP